MSTHLGPKEPDSVQFKGKAAICDPSPSQKDLQHKFSALDHRDQPENCPLLLRVEYQPNDAFPIKKLLKHTL